MIWKSIVNWHQKRRKNKRSILPARWGMMFSSAPLIPWITYTHISHTNSGKKENATPLFDWGKYYEKERKLLMPISVQAHHSFVDGLHIGQFADELQRYLNAES